MKWCAGKTCKMVRTIEVSGLFYRWQMASQQGSNEMTRSSVRKLSTLPRITFLHDNVRGGLMTQVGTAVTTLEAKGKYMCQK